MTPNLHLNRRRRCAAFVVGLCRVPPIWFCAVTLPCIGDLSQFEPCDTDCRSFTLLKLSLTHILRGSSQVEMLKGLHEIIVRKDPALLPVRASSARDITRGCSSPPHFHHLGRLATDWFRVLSYQPFGRQAVSDCAECHCIAPIVHTAKCSELDK